ncbi:hypothetical protein [Streptomyces syringium]|uniref:hypothetical protein n=1 Tax=Streptomyces syringium TaxID=76729 RepID=UPI0037D36B3F
MHTAIAEPAAARPAELGDHRAVHSLTATDNGFGLAVDRPNCAVLIPSLLASTNLLPELT